MIDVFIDSIIEVPAYATGDGRQAAVSVSWPLGKGRSTGGVADRTAHGYPRGMTRSRLAILSLLASLLPGWLGARADGPVRPNHDYVVISSKRCRATDGWRQVVGALAAKHDAEMLFFDESPSELLPELRRRRPRMVGVVAMPDEAGRDRVGAFNRTFRRIVDDPWLDARWGLVTGAEWADAMEVVRATTPLVVRRLMANTPVPFGPVADGVYFDEGVAGRRMERTDGGEPVEVRGDIEIVDDFVTAFNEAPPDLLVTSGRTNEERWMLGYLFDGGRVVVGEAGDLRGRLLDGTEVPIRNPGPMAMLGAGSCLLGFIPGSEVLPLAFIHDAGARQIVGYASTTWHGAGGWDVYRRFLDEPGRGTLSEAVWLAQQELIRRFAAEYPGVPEVSTEGFDEREVFEFQLAVAEATGVDRREDRFEDLAGLLWDRDAIVLLGDPAWPVRLQTSPLPWTSVITRQGDRLRIDVEVHADLTDGPTPIVVLPERIFPGKVVEGEGLGVVSTPDLVFLPGLRTRPPGTSFRVELDAPLERGPIRPVEIDVETRRRVVEQVAPVWRPRLRTVFADAGGNETELLQAIRDVTPSRRASMAFLIANMPPADRRIMTAEALVETVELAHDSFDASPWRGGVPESVFREAVLPYAHINERRDDWRAEFVERFRTAAHAAGNQADAVRLLNRLVYEVFDITYDANKRLKNEQSPYQSIDQHCASCTGLSILLANACRAAGIPARVAGIPEWPSGDNHTWVEVYDPIDGRWHWIEALGGGEYDEGWWVGKVRGLAAEDSNEARHRIWAASWSRPAGVPNRFPLWWLGSDEDPIPGIDRTAGYAAAGD
ncbi:MAG: hypothetical protein CMJ27_12405 [Phycisphaerae bacterium]|nr:hypothetical protein [Phycisphaerae bacterium]OUX00164.1 MAG: hypothetical protein CBD91_07330 [Phycisphaeraceae bacterium TMED231]